MIVYRLLVPRVIDNFQKTGLTDVLVEFQIMKNKSDFFATNLKSRKGC